MDPFVQTLACQRENLLRIVSKAVAALSPEAGFAIYVYEAAGDPPPWDPQPFPNDLPILRKGNAPLLATVGYRLQSPEVRSKKSIVEDWRQGLERLAACDSFPHDRMSFAYRPTELLGIAVGAQLVCDVGERDWLRLVADRRADEENTAKWPNVQYLVAANRLGAPSRPTVYSESIDNLAIADLGFRRWWLATSSDARPQMLDEQIRQLDEGLLLRCATSNLDDLDVQATVLALHALECTIAHRVSSLASEWTDSNAPSNLQEPPAAALSLVARETRMNKSKILFLAANPQSTDRLTLDEEARDIDLKIRAAQHRDSLDLITRWAVQPDDLLQLLNEHRPVVVHFSGHGSGVPGISLHGETGGAKLVSASTLKRLFTTLKDDIRIVVLNACYSTNQAKAIVEVVDCVVGMNKAIGDMAARRFAASFYRALGFGRSVKNAFDQGALAIDLAGLGEAETPQLLVRNCVDAEEVFLIEDSENP